MDQNNIRNFAIIAHVDHGKSTLADRLLEVTETIPKREMVDQVLDSHPIEKERGITIKLAPVRMVYKLPEHLKKIFHFSFFIFNLIDTPGHVDFSYEVSRTLAACDGVILVVDATAGVQAQTIAYMRQVEKRKLAVLPVINKIDLPIARIPQTKKQLTEIFGFKDEEIIEISGKLGLNIDKLITAIIERIPPPQGLRAKPLRMLVFSSKYDPFYGVICFIRVFDGILDIKKREKLLLFASQTVFVPCEIGYFSPKAIPTQTLSAGEVGYVATGLKDLTKARVGDTISLLSEKDRVIPLPGYQEPKPVVFLEIFPVDNNDFNKLRESIVKLHLQDSSFSFSPVVSPALGFGFHCGFLGRLHADIIHERLEREFNLSLIRTFPHVSYQVLLKNRKTISINSVKDFPDFSQIQKIFEPVMLTKIYTPQDYLGPIMELSKTHRGKFLDLQYLNNQVKLEYLIPFSELILDFFDKLKSISSGYASLDYEFYQYQEVDVVKLDILVNKQKVDVLSTIVIKEKSFELGRFLTKKLKETIPRQNFEITIQAAIAGKIISSEVIKPYRKDVTAKLYGGDRTRKDKLLDIQKEGKKRMKRFGKVEIPKEAFLVVLKSE